MKRQAIRLSLPARIRNVQKSFDYWMARRQSNPVAGQNTEQAIAETEAMRLGSLLSDLKRQYAAQMEAIERAFRKPL